MTTPVDSQPEARIESESLLGDDVARVLAFYLPQYHAIPENDSWWGVGFTDWTNVRRAQPLYVGHDQPKVPSALGYYNLLDVEAHHAQAALARDNGLAGFCYYVYWFGGKRLLEKPLQLVAANPDLALPYAICWANEPWSRRWDGSEGQVLMEQRHSASSDADFIDDFAVHLADPRYVRVAGKPLLLIYRASLLGDPIRATDGLRDRAVHLGLGELYLAMVQSFGSWEPISYGFDAAVEFPPHPHNLGYAPAADAVVHGRVDTGGPWTPDLRDAIRWFLSRPVPDFPWFRTVMPGFDNTPRRGVRGIVYAGSTPSLFRDWLEHALRCTYLFQPPPDRLVFVNAWNEWAEGAYLEPDTSNGDAYLRAIPDALAATSSFATDTARLFHQGLRRDGLLEDGRRMWTGGVFPADAIGVRS